MAASAGVFFYCTGHSDERFRKNHILTELVFGDMLRDECKLEKDKCMPGKYKRRLEEEAIK